MIYGSEHYNQNFYVFNLFKCNCLCWNQKHSIFRKAVISAQDDFNLTSLTKLKKDVYFMN